MVIGAAVLLFIASFLDIYSVDGAPDSAELPNSWESGPVLMGVVLAGIIGAALVVVSHGLPQVPKVAGLDLGQFGAAFTVFAAWSALGNIFDPLGGTDNVGSGSDNGVSAGTGLILALIATLVMAAAAVATALSRAPRAPAPRPQARRPPALRRPASRWLRLPGCAAAAVRGPAAARAALRRAAAGGCAAARAASAAGGRRGLLAVLVRGARAAAAVRGGRFADADRRTGARHLVPGRGAARSGSGRADAGRPSWRSAGHVRYPARLSPRARPRTAPRPSGRGAVAVQSQLTAR